MTVITGSIVLKPSRRKDAGRLHVVRHAVLSRHPLEALRHHGEDVKVLRRLEKQFRAELKPQGAVAEIIFDRFWSSYLRCLLAARTEAGAFLRRDEHHKNGSTTPRLLGGDLPTLVTETVESGVGAELPQLDLLHQLSLVQRYDRHYSREMYRGLALLLVLRREGEAGLEQAFANVFGIEV